MPRKYNHKYKIKRRIPVNIKDIKAGMIIEFTYKGEDVHDKNPLVLVLSNGFYDKNMNSKNNTLLHGINLNYLSASRLKFLSEDIQKAQGKNLDFIEEDRDEKGRFISEVKRYTRLNVPVFHRQIREAEPISSTQIKKFMQSFYKKVLKKSILNTANVYRTYIVSGMKNRRAVKYEFK